MSRSRASASRSAARSSGHSCSGRMRLWTSAAGVRDVGGGVQEGEQGMQGWLDGPRKRPAATRTQEHDPQRVARICERPVVLRRPPARLEQLGCRGGAGRKHQWAATLPPPGPFVKRRTCHLLDGPSQVLIPERCERSRRVGRPARDLSAVGDGSGDAPSRNHDGRNPSEPLLP